MHSKTILVALVIGSFLFSPCSFSEKNFVWPNSAKAAVTLSYDDALKSQLDNAIPQLNAHGFKASFYVHIDSPGFTPHIEEWKKAAQTGHELGNHSIFHQCVKLPERTWVKKHHDLRQISADQMYDEIVLANKLLAAIDGREKRTLTIPCGDYIASGQNYIDLVQQHFLGIKSVAGAVPDSMTKIDRNYIGSIVVEDLSGEALISIVKDAAKKGTMASIIFHGVGGDYLAVSNESHKTLLAYLAKHKDVYWVDTFANIMQHVNNQLQAESGVPVKQMPVKQVPVKQ